jgi:signal transduction histidine kinase
MLGANETDHAERQEYATLAIEECDRLNSMIDELLEFTRGGRSKLDLRTVRLENYLADLEPAIRSRFGDSPIRLEMRLGYEGALQLDPERMSRAVLNMVLNACQAMNGSGVLIIRTEQQGDRAVIEFRDTGCGIPEDIRHRVFDPFFSYGKAQGIGLGMSITRKIVEEHGGEISLTSEVGLGTRVQFSLPIPEEPPEASDEDPRNRRST